MDGIELLVIILAVVSVCAWTARKLRGESTDAWDGGDVGSSEDDDDGGWFDGFDGDGGDD